MAKTTMTAAVSMCLVFFAQLTFGSDVRSKAMVDFHITEVVPDQTNCNASATVCVQTAPIAYSLKFSGQFPLPRKILAVTAFGGANSVQIPVVYASATTTLADPMVGIFQTPTLTFGAALNFTVTLEAPTITETSNIIMGSVGMICRSNTLCFLIAGQNIILWGTKGAVASITVTGTGNQEAVIPLIQKGVNEGSAVPQLLAVPADGRIQGSVHIEVSFEPTTLVVQGGSLVNSTDCPATSACYAIFPSLNMATFSGVVSSEALTFTLRGRGIDEFLTATFRQDSTQTGCPA